MTQHRRICLNIMILIIIPLLSLGASGPDAGEVTHDMTRVVFQLAAILLTTWLGGRGAELIHLPAVVGQLLAGIIIGPYLLGSLPLPGFSTGLFPDSGGAVPVGEILYALSSIAAIILLFNAGLETDLSLFLRYAAKGSLVGIGGVIFSFFSGAWLTSLFTGEGMFALKPLFMGTLSVATSVGITASILSERRKMDSPEGVVILSAAVIDDVLGIIILAVVLGIAEISGTQGHFNWSHVGIVAVRAIGVWLAFTAAGLVFGRRLSRLLKDIFHDLNLLAVMAFGLALFLGGIFESAGLSMIIGAYVTGLALSNTDLAFVIQSRTEPLYDFLVPVFFAVNGMMVDLNVLSSLHIVQFGLIFTVVAIAAKLVGAGLPALATNFTPAGAYRIGLGMVPRGEVALIIAGIGASSGIIQEEMFGTAIIMTILSTILAPPLLNRALASDKPGQKHGDNSQERTETRFSFQSPEFAQLILAKFTNEMEKEGFFVITAEHGEEVIQMRKEDIFISLYVGKDGSATFLSAPDDVNLFKTALYESLISVNKAASELKSIFKPDEMARSISEGSSGRAFDILPYTSENYVRMHLEGNDKFDVLAELVKVAETQELLADPEQVLYDVLEREKSMTTGLASGIAMPHAKSEGIQEMKFLIGLKKEGMDFEALDGQPSNIFIMILSPAQGNGPHIQLMSTISGLLNNDSVRENLLAAESPEAVLNILNDAQKAAAHKKTGS